jgi:hypothetical protein
VADYKMQLLSEGRSGGTSGSLYTPYPEYSRQAHHGLFIFGKCFQFGQRLFDLGGAGNAFIQQRVFYPAERYAGHPFSLAGAKRGLYHIEVYIGKPGSCQQARQLGAHLCIAMPPLHNQCVPMQVPFKSLIGRVAKMTAELHIFQHHRAARPQCRFHFMQRRGRVPQMRQQEPRIGEIKLIPVTVVFYPAGNKFKVFKTFFFPFLCCQLQDGGIGVFMLL